VQHQSARGERDERGLVEREGRERRIERERDRVAREETQEGENDGGWGTEGKIKQERARERERQA